MVCTSMRCVCSTTNYYNLTQAKCCKNSVISKSEVFILNNININISSQKHSRQYDVSHWRSMQLCLKSFFMSEWFVRVWHHSQLQLTNTWMRFVLFCFEKNTTYFSLFNLSKKALRGPPGTYCDPGTYPSLTTYATCQSSGVCVSTESNPIYYGLNTFFCDCASPSQVVNPFLSFLLA